MKSKLLKTLSVVALLGCGVVGSVACSNNASSEQVSMSIVAEANSVDIGSTIQLMLNKTSENVKWISSNKAIATVDENGVVTGVSEGEVTISAMTTEGKVDIAITVTDPEADIRGNVIFDEEKVPSEIIIGDDNAINVEDFVTVTKVSHWSLVSDSTTIEIDGHKVTGVDYGEFSLTIKAGKTRRILEGRVVSKAKVKLNTFIDSIGGNYTIMNSVNGLEMVNLDKNYYASVSDSTETGIILTGSMPGKDGRQYSFNVEANVDSTGNIDIDNSKLILNKGYGRRISTTGLDEFNADGNVGGTAWTEIISNGEPTGAYLLEDKEVDQYSTVISNFLDRIAPDYYININSMIEDDTGSGIAALALLLGNDGTFAQIYPVNEKGNVIQSVSYNGGKLSIAIQISDVGTTSIKSVEDWIANPTYPEQIDISPISDFFENMAEKRTFTSTASASWINPTTGAKIACPAGMKVNNAGKAIEVLPTFDYTSYANANAIYKKVYNMNEYYDAGAGSAGDSTSLLISKNNKIYLSSSTDKDGVQSWSTPVQNTQTQLTDVWENSLEVPTIVLSVADEDEGLSFLQLASFEGTTTDETSGEKTWYMNYNGYDTQYNFTGINYGEGVNAIMASQTDYYAAIYMTFWMGAQGWIYDACDMSFVLSEDGNKLTYNMEFVAGSTIGYLFTISFYDIGTDAMPADAQAVVDAIE